jgi:hypothetical protein
VVEKKGIIKGNQTRNQEKHVRNQEKQGDIKNKINIYFGNIHLYKK